MRLIKPTSKAMITGGLTTVVLFILKILAIGILVKLSWWLIVMPLLIIFFCLICYVAFYIGKIIYRNRKYRRQQQNKG